MSSMLPPGNAVQVISLLENSPGHDLNRRHLRLDTPVVREIIQKTGKCPIVIIAIAGPARRGKSFMLSYIVRYLSALEKSDNPQDAGDWINKSNPNMSIKDKGFKFQNGVETTTEGIWMWSRPFIIARGSSKVAVLLMDTAGCFDSVTSEAEESAVIGLSLLISSCFIFNESFQINQNTLTTLAKFMQYGQLASKMFQAKCFQRIMFLVRDWNVPTKFEYGTAGGKAFITDYMTPTSRMSKEAIQNRKSIQDCFDYLDCYLMPHPGEKVLDEMFTGSIGEMKEEFQRHIEQFVINIVADAPAKTHAGSSISSEGLLSLFTGYVDAFNSEEMPSPVSILTANIRSSYETKLRQEINKYKTEMEKKLRQPFILQERLQMLHDKYKIIAISNFAETQNYHQYEQDKEMYSQRLEDELQRMFLNNICQQLQHQQNQIISQAESVGSNNFENALKDFLGVSFWSNVQFEQLVEKAQQIGLEEFLKSCSNPPDTFCNVIVPQFLQKLENLKEKYWHEMETRRCEAEEKINKVCQSLKMVYLEDFGSNLDDKYSSPKTLEKWHERYRNRALTGFTRDVQQFNFIESFLTLHRQKFEDDLNSEFNKIRKENEQKLATIISQAERDIKEAIAAFNERANTILENMDTTSQSELIEIHTEILLMAHECLDESDLAYLPSIIRNYKKTLEDGLNEALQRAMDAITNSLEKKKDSCQQTLNLAYEQYCADLNAHLLNDDYLETYQFEQINDKIKGQIRQDYEKKLYEIDHTDGPKYLQLFDEKVAMEKERKAVVNNMKRLEAESKVETAIRNARQDYCTRLAEFSDPDQLEKGHAELALKAIQSIYECGVQSQRLLERYRSTLEDELEEELESKKKVMEVKAGQLKQVLTDALQNSLEDYEAHLMCFVQENPFASNREFDLRQDKIFKEKVSQFQQQAQSSLGNSKPPQLYTINQLLDQLKINLKDKKKFLKSIAQTKKIEANEAVEKLQSKCFSTFTENLNGFSTEENITKDEFEKRSKDLLEQIENLFEASWIFPLGPKKESTIAELRKKMHTEFQKVVDSQVSQRLYAGHTVTSILTSFCIEVDSHLNCGGFYENDFLEEELQRIAQKAQETLINDLRVKKINPKDSLSKLQKGIEDKFEMIRNKNISNVKNIESQAQKNLQVLYNDKSQIKSLEDLNNFMEKLTLASVGFAREKFRGPDVESSVTLRLVSTLASTLHDQLVNEMKEASNSKTAAILTKAVDMYTREMTTFLENGPSPAHPDDLNAYSRRSLEDCITQAEKESIILTGYQKCVITQRIENTFRIFKDKNALIGAQHGNVAIGIDLGTTTSCVAVYQNGRAFVIKDDQDRNLTPSYVYFPPSGCPTIGHEAKEFAQDEPENTIFDAKRLIGRMFSDPHVKADIKTWPFVVQNDGKNNTKIVVRDTQYSPEEISGQVLIHMKKIAERFFRKPVMDAVITVPANFSDSQRDSTRQAAQVAGLNVLRIINEPTAAAIAHALSWKDEEKLVLVFDFGGGTFDVSILKTGGKSTSDSGPVTRAIIPDIEQNGESSAPAQVNESEGGLQVLTTLGDTHLGGEDFDSNMVKYCVQEFEKLHPVKLMLIDDPTGPNSSEAVKRRIRRMRDECERVKRSLTSAESALVSLDAIYLGLDLRVTITRTQFELMNEYLFQQSMDIVRRALDDAHVEPHELSDVIMVGGSSRIPRVRQLLEQLLGKSSINVNQDIDIQEAVALGASVQACILHGGENTKNLPRVKDVQPFSLGIKILGGEMSPIIRRNSTIPCVKEQPYVTTYPNQEAVDIEIYSGEEKMAARNTKLGKFTLTGLPPGAAGSQKLMVNMKIDENGILNVTATCISNGKCENLLIEESRGRLTDFQVNEMRARAHGMEVRRPGTKMLPKIKIKTIR